MQVLAADLQSTRCIGALHRAKRLKEVDLVAMQFKLQRGLQNATPEHNEDSHHHETESNLEKGLLLHHGELCVPKESDQ